MANLSAITNQSVIDTLLPKFGKPQSQTMPRYNAESRAFFSDEYQSAAGNYSYKLVRFSAQVAMVEKIGHYHNWKYLNSVAVYAYNGTQMQLLAERSYGAGEMFYDAEFAKQVAIELLDNHLREQAKLYGLVYDGSAEQLITETYNVFNLVTSMATSTKNEYYKLLNK